MVGAVDARWRKKCKPTTVAMQDIKSRRRKAKSEISDHVPGDIIKKYYKE